MKSRDTDGRSQANRRQLSARGHGEMRLSLPGA